MPLLLLYAALAIGISFACSVTEAVLLSVTPSYVARLQREKQRCGHILSELKSRINRPLAAILSLNTIANTAGAAGVGAQAAVVFGNTSVGLVSAVLTLMILIFSEIIPKTVGSVYWRGLSKPVAYWVRFLTVLLFPLVVLAEKLTQLISGRRSAHMFTREEFSAFARLGHELGHIEPREYRIVGNLLRFRSYTVREIMTPRTVVFALQENMRVADVVDQYGDIEVTRIPVYGNDKDEVTGFVLKTDILLEQATDQGHKTLKQLKRDIKALPETASLFDAFQFLLDHSDHMALVVDEYGGMAGVITLEDVVETLLGLEIVDEADVVADMQALARTRWEKQAARMGITG